MAAHHRAPLNLPSFRLDDFSFPSLLLPSSPSSQSTSSSCPSPSPSPSPAFYSSPSVCHSSPCIDVTFRPAATRPVWEFECVENLGDIFLENLGDIIDLKNLDDRKDAFVSEDLGPDFWPPTHGVENHNESPPRKETIGDGVAVTNSQEDKDISCSSISYPELDFAPPVPVDWVSSSCPNPLPDLVSPRDLRMVPGMYLAKSAASLHCSSPSFSSPTFALDSPLTSDLTVSGSSEPHICELHISDGDSVSTADRDPAHTNDHELQETGTVVIQVKTDNTNLDDGYVWRKYGEKSIKHRSHRRSYFRCANSGCPIRKRIERASEKCVFMTYVGRHNHYI